MFFGRLRWFVPGAAGGPSKWVSYIITTVPTTTVAAAPQRPGTDNTGTLVDNGDGTYKYTFYRDVTTIKAQVAAMTVTAPNSHPARPEFSSAAGAPTVASSASVTLMSPVARGPRRTNPL